jgi:hypothetical protein
VVHPFPGVAHPGEARQAEAPQAEASLCQSGQHTHHMHELISVSGTAVSVKHHSQDTRKCSTDLAEHPPAEAYRAAQPRAVRRHLAAGLRAAASMGAA